MAKAKKSDVLEIEHVPIGKLKIDESNARAHKTKGIDAIKKSLTVYGQQKPIVVDRKGLVIAGNGTLQAAVELGWKQIAVVRTGLRGGDKTAYAIADNRIAELSDWNQNALGAALATLKTNGDLNDIATGFTSDEMERIVAEFSKHDPLEDDEIPGKPKKPKAKKGDVFILGDHRLMCGSSTEPEDVERLMGKSRADLVATDPPYMVDYTGADRPGKKGGRVGKDWSDVYHEIPTKDAPDFYRALYKNILGYSKPNAALMCWLGHKCIGILQDTWKELGIIDHQLIVWVKSRILLGYSIYAWKHEQCLLGWKKGKKPAVLSNEFRETIWEIESKEQSPDHPTSKPIKIFGIPMLRHTKEGAICFEPFSGSGSQIIAAEKLGRRCFAMEIQPVFVDVAVTRWEVLTKKKAKKG